MTALRAPACTCVACRGAARGRQRTCSDDHQLSPDRQDAGGAGSRPGACTGGAAHAAAALADQHGLAWAGGASGDEGSGRPGGDGGHCDVAGAGWVCVVAPAAVTCALRRPRHLTGSWPEFVDVPPRHAWFALFAHTAAQALVSVLAPLGAPPDSGRRSRCLGTSCSQGRPFCSFPASRANMGHDAVWNSHPKDYGKGGRSW